MLLLQLWLRLSRCQLSYSFALVFILLFANFVRFLPLPFPIFYVVVVILLFGGCLHFGAAALSAYALSCSAALSESFLLSFPLHSLSRSALFCACAALIVCVMLKRCKLTLQHVCCCCRCQKWFWCFFVFVFFLCFFLGGISFQGSNQSWSKLTSDLWPQPDIHQDSQNSQQIAVEQQQQ